MIHIYAVFLFSEHIPSYAFARKVLYKRHNGPPGFWSVNLIWLLLSR